MGITGFFILQHVPGFGAPPIASLGWVLMAMIPLSAFFSALCLAISAFARSTAEGHYYMMPLFMVMLPLMMIPLMPDIKMNLGYSLLPVGQLSR